MKRRESIRMAEIAQGEEGDIVLRGNRCDGRGGGEKGKSGGSNGIGE
jgi:hypothetical protein